MHIKHTLQLANFRALFSSANFVQCIQTLNTDGKNFPIGILLVCAFERESEKRQKQHQSRDLLWLQGKNNCVKTTNERTSEKNRRKYFRWCWCWCNSATIYRTKYRKKGFRIDLFFFSPKKQVPTRHIHTFSYSLALVLFVCFVKRDHCCWCKNVIESIFDTE